MGSLTTYLQQEFIQLSPEGWNCSHERHLLPRKLERLLGYEPRVDILLEKEDGSKRLWIEFEISRADPAANHVKFATSHLFEPMPQADIFIAMISPHVTRGRRNLAANTISLLRHIGMNAFQTVLFPHIQGLEIKRLNHLDKGDMALQGPDVKPELERAFFISKPVLEFSKQRIHFAGDLIEVMLNLHAWNREIKSPDVHKLWGRRTITYFVYEPRSRQFAPSKFCAYIGLPEEPHKTDSIPKAAGFSGMTIEMYSNIDGSDRKFDGKRARVHLMKNLGMIQPGLEETENIKKHFDNWVHQHADYITVHPKGPFFIIPPLWF